MPLSEASGSAGTLPTPGPAAPDTPLWRRALPPALAVALVAFVLWRLDLRAFVRALAGVNHAAFGAFAVAFVLALLTADAFGTAIVYRRTALPVKLVDLWLLRGASYLPSMLNHHVGQAFLVYYLSRAYRAPLARVAGATLVVYASWTGCLLLLAVFAIVIRGAPTIWLAVPIGAGLAYLAVIALRPAVLARTSLLAPLFEAGVAGHLIAMAARIPHLCVMFLGTWIPFSFFGVDIPLVAAAKAIPILMVVVTLPLSIQGLGTRDVVAAELLESFARGATQGERLAALAAATTSWGIALTLLDGILGALLMKKAMSRLAGSPSAEGGSAS